METRKIQLIGSSSYMISLPKKWILSHNLKQGDEVTVYADEGMVVVLPKEYKRLVRIVMKGIPEEKGDFLRRYIYAIYMLGFDEIVLEDIDAASLLDSFTEIVHELIGMEIIDVADDRIVFRILVTPELDVITVLRRIVQMINGMFEDTLTILDKKEDVERVEKVIRNISLTEENIDRFYWLVVRLENRIIREKSFKWNELRFVLGSRMLAKILEDVSDHISRFSRYLAKVRPDDVPEMPVLIKSISELFNKSFNSYIESDLIASNEVARDVEAVQSRIIGELDRLDRAGNVKPALALHHLLGIIWNIKSIAEIAINRAVREMATGQ
jgi:phosphate uptake regulator